MKTLIFGLNPAWQKIISFDSFKLNNVNRALEAESFASGKGINCIRVLEKLGSSGMLVQFTGGDAGKRISEELDSHGIKHISQGISEETRTCTTLISGSSTTEVIEPSPSVTGPESTELLEKLEQYLPDTGIAVFCGTYPPGIDENFFNMLKKIPSSCRVILDGVKGVEPILKHGVHLLKINRHEMNELTGTENYLKASDRILNEYRIDNFIITDGSRPVHAVINDNIHKLELPEIRNTVNIIGAGDAFLAGWLHGENSGFTSKNLVAYASAVSLARCHVKLPWDLNSEDVDRYYKLLKS